MTNIDSISDPFGFLLYDLPLVEAVMNNTLALPYKGGIPHALSLEKVGCRKSTQVLPHLFTIRFWAPTLSLQKLLRKMVSVTHGLNLKMKIVNNHGSDIC